MTTAIAPAEPASALSTDSSGDVSPEIGGEATRPRPLRLLVALAGLHRVQRGAETALENIAAALARRSDFDVTCIGSGKPRSGDPYSFEHVGCVPREKFEVLPSLPGFRDANSWEEATFVAGLWRAYDPREFDVTLGCSYPFTNWVLRRKGGKHAPPHVFVTQNGDWPCYRSGSEFRYFNCDALVCTNPDYFDAQKDRYDTALIPNGVDPERFYPPGAGGLTSAASPPEAADVNPRLASRAAFGLPADAPVVLMVSALVPDKRVLEGARAVSKLNSAHLVVAGDGPLRDELRAFGEAGLVDRLTHLKLPREQMPNLYRCADVFLHMSTSEPSANAYLEALATGLPIVTHDRRVTRWTLEEQAVLLDTTDLDAVAEAIKKALTLRDAEHVAARRELVDRRFVWSRLADQYAEVLKPVARIPPGF